jgi:hypothetical protein
VTLRLRVAALSRFATLVVAGVGFCAVAVGCGSKPPPYQLSDKDQQRFVDVVRVSRGASAAPLIFGLSDCTVYKAVTQDSQIASWRVVLRSDWGQSSYPKFLTGCVDEHMKYAGGFVVIDMCARAIGAGGGCNGGGLYRSRDGERWQIQSDGGAWAPLPK